MIVPENARTLLIHQLLEHSANRSPEKIAVIHEGERIAYGRLNARADRLAGHLRQSGIQKGDRIALLMENGIDYVSAYYAVLKAGAVAAPLGTGLKPKGLRELIDHLAPAAVITHNKFERLIKAAELQTPTLKHLIVRTPKQTWKGSPFTVTTIEEALDQNNQLNPLNQSNQLNPLNQLNQLNQPTQNPTDLASIIYTSGSTGSPKGVMLSHANIVANTLSICRYLELGAHDIQMVVLPFFYVMGKSLLNTHIAAGGTVVINNRFMYPADVVHQMIDEQVTGFSGVPSTYAYLLHRSPLGACRDKLPHLRYCSQAGGHMAAAVKNNLRRVLPAHTRIFIMYGATEAGARLTYLDPDRLEEKIDSIGKPIPGVGIRVLDETGREAADGAEGELVASGPNIMQGYWKDPAETARVLDAQGYHTGDIGFRDPEGFLYVTRRKDSLLKVGGHRINPVEIEDFLLATEQVIECAVIVKPDPLLGNKLVAVVVPREEHQEPEYFIKQCAQALPPHKVPAEVRLVRMIPKNDNGKIDRAGLVGWSVVG